MQVGGITNFDGGGNGSSGSGIQSINSQTGPAIVINGVNGIAVTSTGNVITINGAALSGVAGSSNSCYSASFTGITSQTFTHGLGTTEVIVGIYDSLNIAIIPDDVTIVDANNVTVTFNRAQTGKVVIFGCGGSSGQSGVVGVNGIQVHQIGGNFVVDAAPLSGLISAGAISKFSAAFSNIVSGQFTHSLNSRDVIVQVYEESPLALTILADEIVRENLNQISLVFNRPQSGRVVIIG